MHIIIIFYSHHISYEAAELDQEYCSNMLYIHNLNSPVA